MDFGGVCAQFVIAENYWNDDMWSENDMRVTSRNREAHNMYNSRKRVTVSRLRSAIMYTWVMHVMGAIRSVGTPLTEGEGNAARTGHTRADGHFPVGGRMAWPVAGVTPESDGRPNRTSTRNHPTFFSLLMLGKEEEEEEKKREKKERGEAEDGGGIKKGRSRKKSKL